MLAEIIGNVIKMFILIKVLKLPSEIEWIPKDAKIDPTLMDVEGQIILLSLKLEIRNRSYFCKKY